MAQGASGKDKKALNSLEILSSKIGTAKWSGVLDLLVSAADGILEGTGSSETLQSFLDESRALGTLDSSGQPLPAGKEALGQLLQALGEARIPPGRPRGIAILSLMESRGMIFKRAVLSGVNRGKLPSPARQEIFLSDSLRDALKQGGGSFTRKTSRGIHGTLRKRKWRFSVCSWVRWKKDSS